MNITVHSEVRDIGDNKLKDNLNNVYKDSIVLCMYTCLYSNIFSILISHLIVFH